MPRKQLTDSVMLAAAQRRLREHLDTRPATRSEADAIREAHLDGAAAMEDAAANAEVCRNSLYLSNAASHERLLAAAWRCDGDDMQDVWDATRRELQLRVMHYERLVRAGRPQQ